MGTVFGKRIIVVGGGAQVAQVALGAVSEADRHNLRGERISVDTIPLVGEENIAAAVRAVADLPRARLLVLAGSIMGGDISVAAEELRAVGIPIIALNMVGSITEHVDLVVSDPVQAGHDGRHGRRRHRHLRPRAPARPQVLIGSARPQRPAAISSGSQNQRSDSKSVPTASGSGSGGGPRAATGSAMIRSRLGEVVRQARLGLAVAMRRVVQPADAS